MAVILLRALVGLAGFGGILMGVLFLVSPARPAAQLGLSAAGTLGMATLRADFAGFFAGCGLLALAAAFRNDGRLLTAPMLVLSIALAGRGASLLLDGSTADGVSPMVVEAVLLIIFGLGRLWLPLRPAA